MSSVRTRIDQLQTQAEHDLDEFFDIAGKLLKDSTRQVRDDIEEKTKTQLTLYQEYFKLFKETNGIHVDLIREIEKVEDFLDQPNINPDLAGYERDFEAEAANALMSTKLIRDNYNLLRMVMRVAGRGSEVSGLDQSHQDFNVMSQHLFIVYTYLIKLSKQTTRIARIVLRKRQTIYDDRGQGVGQTNISLFSPVGLRNMAEVYRRLYIVALAIARSPTVLPSGMTYLSLQEVVDDYFQSVDQEEHLIIKEKLIEVLAGRASQDLKFERQNIRSTLESQLGTIIENSNLRQDGSIDGSALEGLLFRNYNNNMGFTSLQGSKPMEGEIVKQLTEVAIGKKPKKYKSRTKTRRKPKIKKFKNPIALSGIAIASAKAGIKMPVMPPRKRKGRPKESGATGQREINKLRLQINRRLPAEVRRNMGRPALINQTGRFSNSVELSDLRQGPKTLIGEYRYMFDPYETFENTGEKRWPTGYNPKPLITKSIRNLAAQYTQQKFTLRRE